MGVIWTRAGPVTAGTMLAGLAAGLQPKQAYWPSFDQFVSSRSIDNVFGVTLPADIAQTALLKKRGQKYVGPDGYFNNSLCPSEFLLTSALNQHDDLMLTHLTIAEINGGIDGLILGTLAKDWNRQSLLSLSQIVDKYYSRHGLSTNAQSIKWSACQRYDNFQRKIDHNQVLEHGLTFALELKQYLIATVSESSMRNAISFALESVKDQVKILETALLRTFFECTDDFNLAPSSHSSIPEVVGGSKIAQIPYSGISDVIVILDTSIFSAEDDIYQQQLVAALALQLDIW